MKFRYVVERFVYIFDPVILLSISCILSTYNNNQAWVYTDHLASVQTRNQLLICWKNDPKEIGN